MTEDIQVEKVMEQTENRTEDNPSALEAVYYVSRWVQVRTPVKKDDLIAEKTGIEARLADINEILGKVDEVDSAEPAEIAPAETPAPVEAETESITSKP
jgi:hypothetical protein